MRRSAWFFGVALSVGVLTGCVERRYVITSDPPGAVVLRNGQPLGAAPADDHFVYYGKYKFTLVKEGYETLQVEQEIPTPWYEYFPLDFISENLVPWPIQDVRRFHYKLEPRQLPRPDQLLNDAQNLRNRGHSLSAPAPTTEMVPPP
ncbi:MAG: PEGA domain-containing protein [Gemmataceae bacterium]|nr:PEGA domain-containing protein [Gemmataceae bacterium]